MAITFFTDPHLGLKRTAHTTSKSQGLLRERLFEAAFVASSGSMPFCLGDLFDTTENTEDVLLDGYRIVKRCSAVLAGNHDISNRADVRSSLQKLTDVEEIRRKILVSADPSQPAVAAIENPEAYLMAIPHCLSQEVFEASVKEACDRANERGRNCKVLLLHCNVGDGHGEYHKESSTLCLTTPLQKLVTNAFDYTLVGHEHVPRELYAGKLVVLGNTFPVSFGEIADRYVYILENGVLTKTRSVIASEIYTEIDCQHFLEMEGKFEVSQDFVEIVGDLPFSESGSLSRALANFWRTNPYLLMLRNSVQIAVPEKAKAVKNYTDLAANVSKGAQESGFAAELNELLNEGEDL